MLGLQQQHAIELSNLPFGSSSANNNQVNYLYPLPHCAGPFSRENSTSGPDLASHFSVSLDYGPDSPLNVDQISFNSLKEKMEIILSGEEERKQSLFESAISPRSVEVTGSGEQHGTSYSSQTSNNISFEEAVFKASKEVSCLLYT